MFQLLDFDVLPERARWLRLWESLPSGSPFVHPGFLGSLRMMGERAVCLTFSWDSGALLFPLVIRPIPDSPEGLGQWDAHTPIGYGGGFIVGEPSKEGEHRAWASFAARLRELGVVSVYLRLLPIADDVHAPEWSAAHADSKPNVVVATHESIDEIWRRYAHKVRKNVKRAEREGLRARFGRTEELVSHFTSIYDETMERVGASKSVRFSEGQVARLVESLADRCFVVIVYSDDEPVSAELVLQSNEYLFSFLGGTVPHGFVKRANDYLKHEVCRYAVSYGRKGYLLGGGSRANDGIYRYKRSFAPHGDVEYRSLGYIFRRDDYELLKHQSAERIDFFPTYRAGEAAS